MPVCAQVAGSDTAATSPVYSTSAGTENAAPAAFTPVSFAKPGKMSVQPRPSVTVDASTLGAGISLSLPVNRHFGLRAAFHAMEISHEFESSGFPYMASASARSASIQVDVAPFGGSFRLSPGVLALNNIRANAHAVVPGGSRFDLGDGTYTSSSTDPITANADMKFGHNLAPMMTIGWHSILPSRWHITMPVEFGAVYTGAAKFNLDVTGSACDSSHYCGDISTDAEGQQDLNKERDKWNNTFKDYPFLPIVSIGIGYRFGGAVGSR